MVLAPGRTPPGEEALFGSVKQTGNAPWHGHPGGGLSLVTEALSQRRLTGFDVSDNAGHGE